MLTYSLLIYIYRCPSIKLFFNYCINSFITIERIAFEGGLFSISKDFEEMAGKESSER